MKLFFILLSLSACDVISGGGFQVKPVEQIKLEKNIENKLDKTMNLRDRMYLAYQEFLNTNMNNSDVDWDFISYKANLIYEKGIINLTDPFIFGIIPEDMPPFLSIKGKLKDLSDVKIGLSNIIYQNALTEAYVSFDCWLEGVESGTSESSNGYPIKKARECRDQVLQKIGIISALVNDRSSVNDNIFKKCESCVLAFKGINCNSFYFDDKTNLNKYSNYVYKRIKQKIYLSEQPTITLKYYTSPMFVKKYNKNRIQTVLNMINNMLNELKVTKKLDVKIEEKKILTSETNLLFKDAITICISTDNK